MKSYKFDWSFDNRKLRRLNIVSFGLPALASADGFRVCPNAQLCASICYARQGRYVQSKAKANRERNLWRLRQAYAEGSWGWIDVSADLIIDIQNMPPRIKRVRIHDSGDFFDYEYLLSWLEVARHLPAYDFYGYTKMIRWYLQAQEGGRVPSNFNLVQSAGGQEDAYINPALPHTRIFPDCESLVAAGYSDATHDDTLAFDGTVRIGLVYHGNRRLPSQVAERLLHIDIGG